MPGSFSIARKGCKSGISAKNGNSAGATDAYHLTIASAAPLDAAWGFDISSATADNICFYMAVNQINKKCIRDVCTTARDTQNVRAVSFNFHTPYPDTKELALSKTEKAKCCDTIKQMMKEGAPVFNLKSAFPYIIENSFPTPCHQCVVMENGKVSVCGRCIDVPGLCEHCGYFFVAEYTLLFRGNLRIILEMLRTYLKFI